MKEVVVRVLTTEGYDELKEGKNEIKLDSILDVEGDFYWNGFRWEKILNSKVVNTNGMYVIEAEKLVIEGDDDGYAIVRSVVDKMPYDLVLHAIKFSYELSLAQISQILNRQKESLDDLVKATSLMDSVGKKGLFPINRYIAIIGTVEEVAIPLPTGGFAVVDDIQKAKEMYKDWVSKNIKAIEGLEILKGKLVARIERLQTTSPEEFDLKEIYKFLSEIQDDLKNL